MPEQRTVAPLRRGDGGTVRVTEHRRSLHGPCPNRAHRIIRQPNRITVNHRSEERLDLVFEVTEPTRVASVADAPDLEWRPELAAHLLLDEELHLVAGPQQ